MQAADLVEILRKGGDTIDTAHLQAAVEAVSDYDIGIDVPVSFGPRKHQGLDVVYYYTTAREGRPIPIRDWQVWAK